MARAVRSGSRADTGLLAACALLSLFATVLPMPIREAIASSLRRTVVAPLLAMQTRAERARNAFVEHDRVSARIDSLTLLVDQMKELAPENTRLRSLLSLARQLKWGFLPAEALHGQGLGDKHSLVLTMGATAGVRPRSAVISPDGLVGQVTTVDPTTSLAIMWTHPDFRASAMAIDGSAFGIVTPHLGSEPDEPNRADQPERYLLELRGVAFRDALKPGMEITTSGLGGVFPRGIPIGTVVGEIKTAEQWSRTYLVRPSVHPADVTNVMILSPQRVTDSLSSVWATPARGDSAARRIAVAADSIVRDSTARALARRRSLDSADAAARAAAATPTIVPVDTTRRRPTTPAATADSVRRSGTTTKGVPTRPKPAVTPAPPAAGAGPRKDTTARSGTVRRDSTRPRPAAVRVDSTRAKAPPARRDTVKRRPPARPDTTRGAR
jgi:rod shape-determining protein MreC